LSAVKQQRNTRQRQVILEELQNLTSHPTAADMYEIVRKRLPRISLGTVYRNLELLAQNKIIQKLDISGTEARFDGNPEPHCHIRCVVCGRIGDLHDLTPDPLGGKSREVNGWQIHGCRIEYEGTCPICRGRR
jgi:Fur family ferric uptake transcriptional regulator